MNKNLCVGKEKLSSLWKTILAYRSTSDPEEKGINRQRAVLADIEKIFGKELTIEQLSCVKEFSSNTELDASDFKPEKFMIFFVAAHIIGSIKGITRNELANEIFQSMGNEEKAFLDPLVTALSTRKHTPALNKALNDNTDVDKLYKPLLRYLNKWREEGAEPQLDYNKLFENPDIGGNNAIETLCSIIIPDNPRLFATPLDFNDEGRCSQDGLGLLLSKHASRGNDFEFLIQKNNDPRQVALDNITKWVFSAKSDVQLVNPHQEGMWRGLTALSYELTKKSHRTSRRCPWPICYIQLRSPNQFKADDAYADVVRRLWVFHLNYWRDTQKEPHEDDPRTYDSKNPLKPVAPVKRVKRLNHFNEILDATLSIRRMMCEQPVIVIFDGYRVSKLAWLGDEQEAPQSLVRSITDNHILTLIERLTSAPTFEGQYPKSLSSFRENKFVVLSDKPLFSDSNSLIQGDEGLIDYGCKSISEHPSLRSISGRSQAVRFPNSQIAENSKCVNLLNFQHAGTIARIQEICLQWSSDEANSAMKDLQLWQSEHNESLSKYLRHAHEDIRTSELFLGVLSALIRIGVKEAEVKICLNRSVNPSKQQTQIIDLLTTKMKEHEDGLWEDILLFVAIAPGGVKLTTLHRLYSKHCELSGKTILSETNFMQKLSVLLCDLSGVLGICRTDHLEGFNREFGSHDRSFPEHLRSAFEKQRSDVREEEQRTIEFDYPQLQSALVKKCDTDKRAAFHFLIAEEALQQQLLVELHTDMSKATALRNSRRLLEAFFHGIASLRSRELNQNLPVNVHKTMLPIDTIDRWLWLYFEIFTVILDDAPKKALSKQFFADGVKSDILKLLSQPEILWGEQSDDNNSIPNSVQKTLSHLTLQDPTIARDINISFKTRIQSASNRLLENQCHTEIKITEGDSFNIEYTETMGHYFLTLDAYKGDILSSDKNEEEHLSGVLSLREDHVAKLLAHLVGHENIWKKSLHEIKNLCLNFMGKEAFKSIHSSPFETINLDKLRDKASPEFVKALSLYGELTSIAASLNEVEETYEKGREVNHLYDMYTEAFAAFYLSNALALHIKNHAPYRTSENHTNIYYRGWIRTCLKLERFSETIAREAGVLNDETGKPGWFWKHADTIKNDVTLRAARIARERPDLIILEATMSRYYVSKNSEEYETFLHLALECLRYVEPSILRFGVFTRLHSRFLVERSKVYRELQWFNRDRGEAKSELWRKLAEYDHIRLQAVGMESKDGSLNTSLANHTAFFQHR